MAVQQGDKLKYLGMELDFSAKGDVTITMNSYITEALEEFPEDDWVAAASSDSDHLFKVNPNGKRLNSKRALLSTVSSPSYCSSASERDPISNPK